MTFATIGDQRLYFEDTGGDGLPLVFCHGFLMDHEMFEPQVALFGAARRCITWDMRHHGQSDGPDVAFTIHDVVADLTGLLDHLGIDRFVVVGFSFGGWVANRIALAAPERVAAVVIMDSYERMEDPATTEAYGFFKRMILDRGFDDEVAATMRGFLFHPDYDATRWISKWRGRSPLSWDKPYDAMFGRDDINDRLAEITCPSIVFHGEANPANAPEVSAELASRLGNNRGLVVIPGAGHTSNLEQPAFVNGALAGFLAGIG